jgi:hypothetical protein
MTVRPEGLPRRLFTPRDDHESTVGKWPLKLECILRGCSHPEIDFMARRQDHRHCFRMDRADLLVGFGSEVPEDGIRRRAFLWAHLELKPFVQHVVQENVREAE